MAHWGLPAATAAVCAKEENFTQLWVAQLAAAAEFAAAAAAHSVLLAGFSD